MPFPYRNGPYLFMIDKIGAVDTTVFAFGPVNPTSTEDREPTVDPLNGFPCAGTPLGRGHLIGLFLGGPDIPHNYAPQYEQWQQGGDWKQMETTIEALGKLAKKSGTQLYIAVYITHDHTGNNYAAEQAAFQQGSLKAWTDFRIPSSFKVGTFVGNAPGAAEIVGALNDNATAGQAILALLSKPYVTLQGDFGHSVMPDPDYRFWYKNLIRGWAKEAHEKAKKEFLVLKTLKEAELRKPANPSIEPVKPSTTIPIQKTKGTIMKPSQKKKLMPVQPPRLNGRVITRLAEEHAASLTGFEDNTEYLTDATWKSANVHKIVEYIRDHLASVGNIYEIRPPELNRLNGLLTAPGEVNAAVF